jgi:hypothetical protein
MRSTIFVVGITGSLVAVACGEAYAFSQPSDAVCNWRPTVRDFGPPEGCGHGPGEHARETLMTALSTTSVITTPAVVVVWDPDYVRLDHFPFQYSRLSSSVIATTGPVTISPRQSPSVSSA